MGTMNKILILSGIVSVLFIALCFVSNERLNPCPLTGSHFGSVGSGCRVMGRIKNVKEKNNGNNR